MTTSPSLYQQVEESLAATYVLKRELGGGGMSHVYLAEERSLERDVVIKVLQPELAAGVSADRFAREVRLAAQLQQANIVPLLTSGEVAGLPYYSMPFVQGESLRALLDARGQIPFDQVTAIATDVTKALAYAHARGVVHRDIKPENILLSGGTAVVTDFGIAKAIHASRTLAPFETLTQIGTSLGTPAYMAPEQAMGDPATDHRADIYALGVTMYEMLAGARPFTPRALSELVRAHMMEPPPALSEKRADVPPALAAVVMQCLAKDPSDRPASAEELLHLLARASTTVSQSSSATTILPAAPRRTARWIWVATAAIGVVAMSAIAFALAHRHDASVSTTDANVDPARVVVATPVIIGAEGGGLAAVSGAVADALVRALGELSSLHHVDLIDADSSLTRVVARARSLHSGTALLGSIAPAGGDSVTLRLRVVAADSSVVLRSLAPITIARGNTDAALRDALEPALSTIAIVSYPGLGPASLPLGTPPRLAAVRELITGLGFLDTRGADNAEAGRMHLVRAWKLDSTYRQARLWEAYFIQRRFPAAYFPGEHSVADTVRAEVAPVLDKLSPLERGLYELVFAIRQGHISDEIAELKHLRTLAPGSFSAASLAEFLLDLNRPREALSFLQTASPDRDPSGVLVPAADDPVRLIYTAQIQHDLHDLKGELSAAAHLRQVRPYELYAVRMQLIAQAWGGDSAVIDRLIGEARSMPSRSDNYSFFGDVALSTGQELEAHGHAALGRSLILQAVKWFESRPVGELDKWIQIRRVLAYHALGEEAKASVALAPLLAVDPNSSLYIGLAGRIAAVRGDTAEAERRARQLALPRSGFALGADEQERAFIAADLGRKDEAVALLQEAFAKGLGWNVWWRLHWFNDLEHLRDYPSFQALLVPQG